jgi:hypothetical protein
VREIRRELNLKDARNRGHKTFMKIDKLMVNGRAYSLKELKEKIKLVRRSYSIDNPDGGIRQEEEMSQQSQVSRKNVCKEMSSSDASRQQGKEGSYGTTVEKEKIESPRLMKDDTKQQR